MSYLESHPAHIKWSLSGDSHGLKACAFTASVFYKDTDFIPVAIIPANIAWQTVANPSNIKTSLKCSGKSARPLHTEFLTLEKVLNLLRIWVLQIQREFLFSPAQRPSP